VLLEAVAKRVKRIDELKAQPHQGVGKLNEQDVSKKKTGRKLSDGGARAKFYREVCWRPAAARKSGRAQVIGLLWLSGKPEIFVGKSFHSS